MMMRSMPSNRLSLTWMEIKAINLSPKMPEKFSMTLIKQKITTSPQRCPTSRFSSRNVRLRMLEVSVRKFPVQLEVACEGICNSLRLSPNARTAERWGIGIVSVRERTNLSLAVTVPMPLQISQAVTVGGPLCRQPGQPMSSSQHVSADGHHSNVE